MSRLDEYDKENHMDPEEPATKRRSMLEGSTSRRQHLLQFAKGSVTRVRVHNFMTYNDATFEPGPRLNLVLGPNGTGKSSLVCALCLGLAGGTKLLGRGDNPKEFIQRGKTEAWVEVSLSRGDGTEVVVRRDIKRIHDPADNKTKARSDWRINGIQKLMKDVTELMTQLNVQLDNLCQFLPQDKVVEFARLTPCELLAETEKAIGDSTLYTLHQELVQKRGELKEASQGTEQKKRQLERLQQEQEGQQHEYERLQRRAALLEEVELLKKKVLMMDVEGAKAEVAEVRKLHRDAEKLLKQQQANMRRAEGPLQQYKDDEKHLKATISGLQATLRALKTDASNADRQVSHLDEMITNKSREQGDLQHQSDERKEKIAEARRQLAKANAEAAQVPQQAAPEEMAQLRSLQQQMTAVSNQVVELDMKASGYDVQQREKKDLIHDLQAQLQRISDTTASRLRTLDARHRGVAAAYHWVRENRGRLRGEVFGPVGVDLVVPDRQHQAYFNMAVPHWVWSAFVVMHREDETLLTTTFRQHGWKVAVTAYTAPDYNTPFTHPDGEPETLAHLGITHTLDQVIVAPRLVSKALEEHCRLTRAYIGTQRTAELIDQVEAANLRTVYTPELRYTFTRSRYNPNALTSRQEPLRGPAEVLQEHVDAAQVAELRDHIAAAEQAATTAADEAARLRQQLALLRAQQQQLAAQKQELAARNNTRVAKLKALTNSIRRHTATLAALEAQPEPLERREQLHAELQELGVQYFSKYRSIVQNLWNQWVKSREAGVLELQAGELRGLLEQAKAATDGIHSELKLTEAGFRQLDQQLSAKKAEFERLKQKAIDKGLGEEGVQARLAAIPGDRAELEERMAVKRAEAETIAAGDQGVLQRYQERAGRIAELQAEVGGEEEQHAQRQAAIDSIKARWLPDLERMVEKIRTTFSRNFAEMGCAGEVALMPHPDFDKYAIEIRVKFRASEELQVLTSHRQSGGERSVSTILYLIALQDVTVTPFRVVDEINQGMDPINERKVYTQLVEASTRPNTPQCFLLTPKLLPDLPYTGNITILEIFNGREIDKSIDTSDMDALMFGTRHRLVTA